MKFPWRTIIDAITLGLSKPTRPALPPDAERELARWTPEEITAYENSQREAPPDAPHIEDGGI